MRAEQYWARACWLGLWGAMLCSGCRPHGKDGAPTPDGVAGSNASSGETGPASSPDAAVSRSDAGATGGGRADAGAQRPGPRADAGGATAEEGGAGAGGAPDTEPDAGPMDAGSPALELTGSTPAAGASEVPCTSLIELDFASTPSAEAASELTLDCGTSTPAFDVDPLDDNALVLNPRGPLPAGAACELTWPAAGGPGALDFTLADSCPSVVVPYDRSDHSRLEPFPDDYYLSDDASTPTGYRVDVAVPDVDP